MFERVLTLVFELKWPVGPFVWCCVAAIQSKVKLTSAHLIVAQYEVYDVFDCFNNTLNSPYFTFYFLAFIAFKMFVALSRASLNSWNKKDIQSEFIFTIFKILKPGLGLDLRLVTFRQL
ncbi:hypothetical protein BpHYR1_027109 [Brachionus plicatilis]|uniref:Uncharacterized protein n=1 Tax=Brachionus plicatilis TaxID=10195 RepID=A0A3M7QWI3_BRAPC|nr:hypothetical protein BpHYR1_027109 [Brachionus plicatilis]